MGMPDLLDELHAAGLTLSLNGDKIIVTPRARLTASLRQAITANRPELMSALAPRRRSANPLMSMEQTDNCHHGAWGDAEIEQFIARRDRLLEAGLASDDADHLAERLVLRDRETDDRVVCAAECRHHRAGICANHVAAMAPRELGEFATMLQRCPAYEPCRKRC